MNRCQGLAGLLFGHKFKPRFSESAANISSAKAADADQLVKIANAIKSKAYHQDVCERCGQTIKEQK